MRTPVASAASTNATARPPRRGWSFSARPWRSLVRSRVVDAALGLDEARPSAGPRIRVAGHPPGTRRAADGGIAIEEQRIDDDAALGDVRLDVGVGPPSDGVDLHLSELCVVLDHTSAGACRRVGPPQAGDPGVISG